MSKPRVTNEAALSRRALFGEISPVVPRRLPAPSLRLRLEAAIEQAIAALDALDGDPDIEEACEDEGFDSDREPEEADIGYDEWAPAFVKET